MAKAGGEGNIYAGKLARVAETAINQIGKWPAISNNELTLSLAVGRMKTPPSEIQLTKIFCKVGGHLPEQAVQPGEVQQSPTINKVPMFGQLEGEAEECESDWIHDSDMRDWLTN